MNDRHAAQVKQVFALAAVARAVALPGPDVGQRVLNLHALTQRRAAGRRLLAFAQLLQQALVAMDADAASVRTRGALSMQRADLARRRGEMDETAGHKGHLHPLEASQDGPHSHQAKK